MRGLPPVRYTDQQQAKRGASPKSILPLPCAYETLNPSPQKSRAITSEEVGSCSMRPRLSGLSVSEGSSLCIPPHAATAKAGAFAYSNARTTAKAGAFAYSNARRRQKLELLLT